VNGVINSLDDASPDDNQPITTAKIADARWLLNACEDLRMEWLPLLPSPTEVTVGRVRHAAVRPRPIDWTRPDLHEAARLLPTTDREFKSTVNRIWESLEDVSVEYNGPTLTDKTLAEVPRLLDAIAELREEWWPWLQPRTLP
jgi:hypothetical protein